MANDRDCENCKHHKEVCKNGIFYHSCESWDCEFEPKEDAEPCEDAISRQAAIDAIYARYIGGKEAVDKAPANDQYAEGIDEAVCAVEDLPPVNPQPKTDWIPVSERLPHKGEYGKVLVTYIPSGGTLWTTVIIAQYSDLMGIAKPSFHIGEVGKESFQNITEQVIAWMPLPTLYKGEREDEE